MIQKIKKRNGSVVEFDANKITAAMEKGMRAVLGKADRDKLIELTNNVVAGIEKRYGEDGMPDVEGAQDVVEKALMDAGFYDVVKAYILYRERHRELREEKQKEILKKIEEKSFFIIKRSGEKQIFDERKLKTFFNYAMVGYEGVIDVDELVEQCKTSIYEGIKTEEIARLAVMTVKAFIEQDPNYSVLTSRLFLSSLYKEVIGKKYQFSELDQIYKNAFKENIKRGVEIVRLSPALLNFDLNKLAQHLVIDRDNLLTYRGLQTLYDRYFIYDKNQRLETPQMFWMRVAMGLSINEIDKERWTVEFYNVLSTLRFVSSTPTLFNSGTIFPQLSSCYLTTVEDDLHHIFKCISDNAQLSKFSGGLGNDWSNIRSTGSLIKTTNVESQGVIPFLKIANDTTVAINRSGKRRGATCAYLETWHLDIEEFLDLRRNTGDERRRTHDMNTANWIPDLFMKRVIDNKDWTLFSPNHVPELHHIYGKKFEEKYIEYENKAEGGELPMHKKIKARDLWRKMITRLFETGHPWITFKDPCNIRSPQDHVGVIHSSNLCTEITLNTSKDETAVCNLGSVNFAKHIQAGRFDEILIKDTVTVAMRMLDNVIDINFYPTQEAKNSNLKHRPVGLGIMGYQDALFLLDLNFDSDEAVDFADRSMEIVSYYAILSSSQLAKERGVYESFKGSKWDRGILPLDTLDFLEKERGLVVEILKTSRLDWSLVREAIKNYGMRNSNCLAMAPTATISNISGCFPTIEPIYKNLYVKSNMSGEFTVDNNYLIEDLKALGYWNKTMLEKIKAYDGNINQIPFIPQRLKDKYKEAFDIEPEWMIKAAAYRGKWIDQSQSLNIFSKTSSGKRLSDIYIYAWKMGLKTTYYLRTTSASGVEKSTIEIKSPKIITDVPVVSLATLAVVNNIGPTCEACQ
ncbi:MAG: ribonucleoside-diphosphate reductase subunit alpha [Patescibacteria group bacterium]